MSKPRPRRRRRKVVLILVGLVAAVGLLVALGPTLLTRGIGRELIRRAIDRRVNGSVDFDHLELAWFGRQVLEALVVTDADGQEVVRLDLEVRAGLFDLLLGRVDELEIDLSGALRGAQREDGSTSFEDLLVKRHSTKTEEAREWSSVRERFSLEGLPATTIRLTGLTLGMRDAVRERESVLVDAAGEIVYVPGELIRVGVHGTTVAAERSGSFDVAGELKNLFDAGGFLSLDQASGRIDVDMRNVRVPLEGRDMVLEALRLSASSEGLVKQVVLTVEADALIDGTRTGRLEGTITAEQPVRRD